jgi:GNAT superfamily N-acetyltransferase
MHLREADEGDAAAVTALWTEAYAEVGPGGRQEPYALREYFAVAGRARRQGIGRALVLGATERARELGAEGVALWSRPYQTAAHALYGSLGWRRVAERDEDDRVGRRWVFSLDL